MPTLLDRRSAGHSNAIARLPVTLRRPMRMRLRAASLRLALTAAPMPLIDIALSALARAIVRRHPGLAARLAPSAGARILIDFSDMSCALLLTIEAAPKPPSLRLATGADRNQATAIVGGELDRLLDLLDGRVDGDTMFFSRDLFIGGDTSAVLLLRNALDGEDIDLFDDALELLGPLSRPARRVRHRIAALAQGMERRRRPRPLRRDAAAAAGGGRSNEA